ncbi:MULTISPECIES: hypothetical protein [Trichocoleus]|uniref:Uncharacterized protein n=1 Tax=Trichocoleus desertorum GB2-A4 TaxID=2933944 RepID=A0ABV0JF83_9CYAN|nr:hypothetical protein [Trichocoleus sp. FACHB-46]MBD1862352.1 hypothetical protein [Trichocoleus sp. FACHB-46]
MPGYLSSDEIENGKAYRAGLFSEDRDWLVAPHAIPDEDWAIIPKQQGETWSFEIHHYHGIAASCHDWPTMEEAIEDAQQALNPCLEQLEEWLEAEEQTEAEAIAEAMREEIEDAEWWYGFKLLRLYDLLPASLRALLGHCAFDLVETDGRSTMRLECASQTVFRRIQRKQESFRNRLMKVFGAIDLAIAYGEEAIVIPSTYQR